MTRPSSYTDEIGAMICRRIATTPIGTTKLCAMYDDMPAESTIYEWRYDHKSFSEMYAEAKRRQAELMAEKLVDMAEEKAYYIDGEGNQRVDGGFIQSQRLQVDTTKWIASKLLPRVYGNIESTETIDKTQLKEIAERVAQMNKESEKEY